MWQSIYQKERAAQGSKGTCPRSPTLALEFGLQLPAQVLCHYANKLLLNRKSWGITFFPEKFGEMLASLWKWLYDRRPSCLPVFTCSLFYHLLRVVRPLVCGGLGRQGGALRWERRLRDGQQGAGSAGDLETMGGAVNWLTLTFLLTPPNRTLFSS